MEANLSELGQMLEPQRRKRTWVLLGFILFAFITVMIGVLSFSDALFGKTMERRQMALKTLEERNFDWASLLGDQEQNRLDILKAKSTDTDKDGLSDYDESRVFGTSAYLSDSDSDGISDFEEVQQGGNPNCDETKISCFIPVEGESQINQQVTESLTNPNKVSVSQALSNPEIQMQLKSAINPEQMRQLLYTAGFDSAKVSELKTEQLIAIRDTLLVGQLHAPVDNPELVAQLQTRPLESFTQEELQTIVKQFGFPQDLVSIIPRDELVAMLKETLNDLINQETQRSLISGETNQNP